MNKIESLKGYEIDSKIASIIVSNIDEVESFNIELSELIALKGRDNVANKIDSIIKNKNVLFNQEIKNFYNKYEMLIKQISITTGIYYFICCYFDYDGGLKPDYNRYMDYFSNHKEQLNGSISRVMDRIIFLNISKIVYLPGYDFNIVRTLYTGNYLNYDYKCLGNVEVLPSYYKGEILYRGNNSNYMIPLKYCRRNDDVRLAFGGQIFLNDLEFDSNTLPLSITVNETIGKLFKARADKANITQLLIDSVDLNVAIEDLIDQYEELERVIINVSSSDRKEELKQQLVNLSDALNTIQLIIMQNDKDIETNNKELTEDVLTSEKKRYLRRREESRIDID